MTCPHVADLPGSVTPDATGGCADCLALGERTWAHLRLCLVCGHVACCDSSPRRHATAHFHASGHPVVRSFEPGERWRWCYADGRVV
ncbi:UBP-type zinc finger domain-containing protein [Saccharothrix algeriensis]|uniref:UBP type Zn finger protein n=1 Tax=Saccharothrix algeriensis TaxID=173560 RepID=A0A8T8HRF3_9PSEU|nr:UBP-type zinc finger domain-containing protein [Saccharothrix algeriensis]MBM7812380.1 putative UBP type Zn finger protein [Saccharothrix algeriensis]QTR01138.1 UBP-type zinc finger domain-containing protein [Saccharothrix algeriensis]